MLLKTIVASVAATVILAGCGGGGGGGDLPPDAVQLQPTYLRPSYAQAASIRETASTEVDWGSDSSQLGMRAFQVNSSAELLRMFDRDRGAVMCQGAAHYLHLKYVEAGYRSFQVGFETEAYSHAITLVEVALADGTKVLTVQDPTFNHSYVDPAGKPMSVFDIMSALAKGRPQDVVRDGGPAPRVEYLSHPADGVPVVGAGYVTGLVGPSTDNAAFTVYRAELSLASFEASYATQIQDHAMAHGVPPSPLYLLFGKPIYTYKSYPMTPEEAAEAAEIFNQLATHHRNLAGGAL